MRLRKFGLCNGEVVMASLPTHSGLHLNSCSRHSIAVATRFAGRCKVNLPPRQGEHDDTPGAQ